MHTVYPSTHLNPTQCQCCISTYNAQHVEALSQLNIVTLIKVNLPLLFMCYYHLFACRQVYTHIYCSLMHWWTVLESLRVPADANTGITLVKEGFALPCVTVLYELVKMSLEYVFSFRSTMISNKLYKQYE